MSNCPHCGATDVKDPTKNICLQCGHFIPPEVQLAQPTPGQASPILDPTSPPATEQASMLTPETESTIEDEVDACEVDFPTALVERGKRTRTRGKKKSRSQELSPALPIASLAKQKKNRQHQMTATKQKKKRTYPAWFVPVLVFLAAVVVAVFAIIASQSKK